VYEETITYINHSPVGHSYKFPSCETETLASHDNDENETVLERDRSSYPVAFPYCIAYAFCLKMPAYVRTWFSIQYKSVMRLDSHMCGDTHCGLQSYGTMSLKTVNTNITVPSSSRLPVRQDRIFLRNVDTHIGGYYTDKNVKVSCYNLAFIETSF